MGASPTRIDSSRVLLVDQPGPELEQIVQCLKEYNVTTIVTDTAAEALSCCEHQDFQLLVSERTLPDMDGFDFFRQVRETARNKDLPIIVLTRELKAPHGVFSGRMATIAFGSFGLLIFWLCSRTVRFNC